jgi:uncharacterized protein YcfJ
MKRKLLILASLTSALSMTPSWADTSYEYAQVVESRPVYRVVQVSTPQQQCREEEVAIEHYPDRSGSNTPVVLSTIIGGAIGNAVGHNKSNQRVGAVLGAVLGHSIGRDIVRNRDRGGYTDYQTVQRCETVYQEHEEERLIGYDVTYLYNGAEYAIRTETDPGEQIRLRVNVQPVL